MNDRGKEMRLRFGKFEFDPVAGELYADGVQVRLQDQPRQILTALLERPGEIVTREVLRDRLWHGDTFVDFEHGLNTAIKKVRQALGDSAESPEFIETLARRGYRFIGTVGPAEPAPPAPSPAAVLPRKGLRAAMAALAIAGLGLTIWVTVRRDPAVSVPPSADSTRRIAVMPLQVLAEPGGDAQSYLGVGIADAITNRLTSLRQVTPRPTWAVLPYRDALSDPASVAVALSVDYLLLGTVQPADGRYRVSVQLVQADASAVWARTYDQTATSLLELQDHVADEVVTALRIELSPPERARLHLRYTRNVAAYDLYLRGRALLVEYTESNMRAAIDHFEKALKIDPGYALARAGLAAACAWFSVRYAYETEALAWGKRADAEARRALDQDPALADAQLAIASAAGTLFGQFDWPTVLERSGAALALDASLDLAHVVRMRAFYHLGLFDDVRREGAAAREVNPAPNTEALRLEVAANLFGGRFGEVAEQSTALLAKTDAPAVRHYLGLARYYLGNVTGAREMLASARRGGQPDVRSLASLASIEAAIGLKQDARARVGGIVRGPYMDHHVAYSLGATFAQLGDFAQSLTWLERAADTGFSCYPWFARDSLLGPIRQEAGFVRLLERLRVSHERRQTWKP